MKSSLASCVPLGFAFASTLLCGLALAEPTPAANAKIVVQVGPLRNAKGSLACRLYKSPAGFPRTSTGTVSQRVKPSGESGRCVFDGLPPGTYAVAVHHDENDNRKLDTNFVGVPVEGYGVSNNRTHALSPPRWDESKVVVESGKALVLGISLRY